MINALLTRVKHGRLPNILQIEGSECGLASLAMIASYFGHKTDLATLRSQFSISIQGATLESLIHIAEHLGLESRPVKLELEHLSELQMPCIIHWNMNHFVVLKSVHRTHIIIHDPASGPRKISMDDAAKSFTGVALELSPASDFIRTENIPKLSLKKMLGRVIGLKRSLIQILTLAISMEIVAILMPFQLQWIVDQVLIGADKPLLTVIGSGFILLTVIQTAINTARNWFVVTLSTNMNFQWMGNVFAHLIKLPLDYFSKRHIGHIATCFSSLDHIQRTLTFNFIQTIIDGLLVIGTLTVMFIYSPLLTVIAMIAVITFLIIKILIFIELRDATAEEIVHDAKQHTHFIETASGIQSIRLFNKGEQRRIGWLNMIADQFNAKLRIHRLNISHEMANKLIFGIERCSVIWIASLMVIENNFSVGMLFAFIAYKEQFSQRAGDFINSIFEIKMLRLHLDRLADILGTEQEPKDTRRAVDINTLRAAIELRSIRYRYSSQEDDILNGINLAIHEGDCIAITGASGCGKTTLAKIMLGLLPATEGEILIDNQPLQKIGVHQYRQIIGTVMQEDQLFTGSIADNICFFDSHRNKKLIGECARLAAIEDDILNMPMGYETLVSDSGTGISGGQKQRILLARALYKKPRILVLDEATSHLDVANELAVNDSIKALKLTRIIIAHRPETIAIADRVIRIENGVAIEQKHIKSLTRNTATQLA